MPTPRHARFFEVVAAKNEGSAIHIQEEVYLLVAPCTRDLYCSNSWLSVQ